MLTGSDKIKILTFNLIHHSVHFSKAHNSRNYITSNHKRRYTVGKAPVYHKVSCIAKYRRMKSRDISHKIIKTVTRNPACTFKIYTVKAFHNLGMIRNFKIRHLRLTKLLNFYILRVIPAYWNTCINYVRYSHHNLLDFLIKFSLFLFHSLKLFRISTDPSLKLLCFILHTLCHTSSDLLAQFVFFCTKNITLGF